ncbi:hypothetical protein PLEOSDRAFT_168349 [Pleurotus ostreatus PC15]|uniref:Uncharacterized protein n=1 Tax=Pleurotus ostreatus (strain PC15) TaxID=1137138 RepID=A0A067NVC8_PLEO1|nr:hypothetical protein PLEOSDRAFT_168349 [Pleurotus ostreatus PC15]
MDRFKKIFKKNSTADKAKARRRNIRRSQSMPLGGYYYEDDPKAVYRGKKPLEASKIRHIPPTDRDLPNNYRGVSVLDISQLTDAQKAREWWYRKQGQPDTPQRIEIRRAIEAAFPPALASPSHSKPAVSEVNRASPDDMDHMLASGDAMSLVNPDETDDSIFGKKLKADLRARYDRAYGPAERTPTESVPRPKLRGSYSTMDLNSSARMRRGPASRQPEVHHVDRQPTQKSRRGETGTYASKSQAYRDGRNKPLPKLPTDAEPHVRMPKVLSSTDQAASFDRLFKESRKVVNTQKYHANPPK